LKSQAGFVKQTDHMEANLHNLPLRDLEEFMSNAQARLKQAGAALSAKHKGGEMEEFRSARRESLALERAVAHVKGEEYADLLDFPVKWCTGAPLPHVVMNDQRVLLAFLLDQPDPNWDGTYVTIKSPRSSDAESLALVEFIRGASTKFGAPNDEVFSGHPLYGKRVGRIFGTDRSKLALARRTGEDQQRSSPV
jgi:hypothetical protein